MRLVTQHVQALSKQMLLCRKFLAFLVRCFFDIKEQIPLDQDMTSKPPILVMPANQNLRHGDGNDANLIYVHYCLQHRPFEQL